MSGETAIFSEMQGSGTLENSEIRSTVAVKLPYQIEVLWKEGSTHEEQSAALGFIQSAMRTVNGEPEAMPDVITALTVRRT